MVDEEDRARHGMAEAATALWRQHRVWGEREVMDDAGPRRVRYNLAESPVAVLGRRRDRDGKPFPRGRNWSKPPNACARISNWRRWARAWRRTGTGS
jgi:hypothetical protein